VKLFLQYTVSGVAAGSLYAIVALGLVLLYRGTRVVNFAHAGFGAIGAYVFWNLYPDHVPMPVMCELAKIVHASYGPVLLGVVAAGLIAFGVYSLTDARYRRI